jgi:putative permease
MTAGRAIQSNHAFMKVVTILALLIAGFWALWHVADLFIVLVASALTAFVLHTPVRVLEYRLGMRRSVAIAVVFLALGAFLTVSALQGIPFLVARAQGMIAAFKTFPFDEKLSEVARSITAGIPFLEPADVVSFIHRAIASGRDWAGSALGAVAGIVIDLLVVPFVVYFVLAEGDDAVRHLIERVPNKYFEMAMNVLTKIRRDLSAYLKGWMLESMIVGLLSMIGFWIIGVPYPLAIGVVAGIANLMPYLGPVVGASLAVMTSLMSTGDFRMLVPILILTGIVRMTDDFVIQPLCFAKSADMHPLMVILTLIAANEIIGVVGMVIAIPFAIILKAAAVQTYWGLKHYSITA